MIRVSHIISGDLWAGASVVAYHLLKQLKKKENIQLSAILLNEGRPAREIRELGIPVDVVDETRGNFISLASEILRISTRRSIDIMHTHCYKENMLAYSVTKIRKGIRLVATQHGMPEIVGKNRNLKYRILSRFNIFLMSKSFDRVVVVSSDLKKIFLEKFAFSADKISMIHNGTDIPDANSEKSGRDVFVVGSMGRFFPVKDYPLFVEVAREVSLTSNEIQFHLAGDGPERKRIEEAIDRSRLRNMFHLVGTVDDLPGFYRKIDLFMNTSLHEGIPMTVLEAMSYGIPVIATSVGGLREIMEDGKEGFLVDERDPKEFAEKCLRLKGDAELMRRMGASAREKVVKDFSSEVMAGEYHLLYKELIGENVVGGNA